MVCDVVLLSFDVSIWIVLRVDFLFNCSLFLSLLFFFYLIVDFMVNGSVECRHHEHQVTLKQQNNGGSGGSSSSSGGGGRKVVRRASVRNCSPTLDDIIFSF